LKIYELKTQNGEVKKYRGFNIKPSVGSLVRVIEVDPEKAKKSGENVYKDLSFDKVYEVYRVVNVNQVLIRDDNRDLVHLYPCQYQVVEEITDKEIELLKQNTEIIKTLDKVIKSKKG
jgi:hypothetical protein